MKALILNNKVIEIQKNEFEVAPPLKWVECDNTITVEHTYSNNNFISPPTVPELTYQEKRRSEYPSMEDYLDAIVKGDDAQKQKYIDDCKAVKEKYPK
tara:strand:+ start:552 stop:845 length:294 start_codon:yes stop_codon:yes gene_type:complete